MRTAKKEESLVRRAQAGDRQAFGELVRIYQNQILYLVYDFVGNYDQAQDIAQDIFMKAYDAIESFQRRSSFETWLKRIAINASKDALRKKKRTPVKMTLKKDIADAQDHNRSNETIDIFDKALMNLSANQKTALVLRYYHGEKINDIAEIMNINENTVRIHLHRAIEKIRQSIRK